MNFSSFLSLAPSIETARNRVSVQLISRAKESGRSSLFEFESEKLARAYGIPVEKAGMARTVTEALTISKKIGFPLVMKIVSQDVLHKTDVGGVKIGINSPSEVKSSFTEIIRNVKKHNRTARIEGVYLQKMAPKTYEFVIGGTRDKQFGPTVMFGLGGIYVELYKDVSFRLAPVSDEEAKSMLLEIRAAPLLTGFRDSKPLDLGAIISVIKSVGRMLMDLKDIDSIDINPLLVYEKACKAVDVRVVLTGQPSSASPSELSSKQA
ncbi:MAG: acetate--CoA ligase family protein [Thaumarchaeota archaeon]|nr:acetate--CoA ligase family protein [Nitrososphaerota archaeon]